MPEKETPQNYVVVITGDGPKVYLEKEFFDGVSLGCSKVTTKKVPPEYKTLSDAELKNTLWRLENYATKEGTTNDLGHGGA